MASPVNPDTKLTDSVPRMSPSGLPRLLSQRTARRLLSKNGWTKETGGKHVVKMVKDGHRPITLPKHKGQDYSLDLTRAILMQAGLLSRPEEREA